MARTHVILPDDLLEEIDKLVGERKRSEFLSEAASKELKRRRLIEAARLAEGSLRDAETPSEWETSEGAAAWVRTLRHGSNDEDDSSCINVSTETPRS
jgi:hypothetical protein